MKHSTGKPTKAEQLRFDAMKEAGCVACILDGRFHEPGEVNHIVKGRKRLGHEHSYFLCPYHHRNVPPCDGLEPGEAEERWGPSLAASPAAFREVYGSDEKLLEIQNRLVQSYLAAWRGEYT